MACFGGLDGALLVGPQRKTVVEGRVGSACVGGADRPACSSAARPFRRVPAVQRAGSGCRGGAGRRTRRRSAGQLTQIGAAVGGEGERVPELALGAPKLDADGSSTSAVGPEPPAVALGLLQGPTHRCAYAWLRRPPRASGRRRGRSPPGRFRWATRRWPVPRRVCGRAPFP
jgi:hypothetical protein